MKVLLIRNNAFHAIKLRDAIRQNGYRLCDVTEASQISINSIGSSKAECKVSFQNRSPLEFDKIWFLNTPFSDLFEDADDNIFGYCEIDAALIALLAHFPEKLINRGLLEVNRSLLNPTFLLFSLQKIGWTMDKNSYSLEKPIASSGKLIITRSAYWFDPFADVYFPNHHKFERLIYATQQLMFEKALDLITINFLYQDEHIYLQAVSLDFEDLSMQLLGMALTEVL